MDNLWPSSSDMARDEKEEKLIRDFKIVIYVQLGEIGRGHIVYSKVCNGMADSVSSSIGLVDG